MEASITVILNCYKRPEYMEEQIKALRAQTVPPTEIWVWTNAADGVDNDWAFDVDKIVHSGHNFKYHGRFALGLLAQTKYVAFFDDDTIPGDMWFENCLNTMKETPGILGGAGCILHSRLYHQHQRMGWPVQNPVTMQVDLVGHAWFLSRENLNYMWYETPISFENGEDIQLSYHAKKHGDVNTYCPPHPSDNLRMHSSLKAVEYGNDNKASSNGSLMPIADFYNQRDMCISHGISNGWNTVLGIK